MKCIPPISTFARLISAGNPRCIAVIASPICMSSASSSAPLKCGAMAASFSRLLLCGCCAVRYYIIGHTHMSECYKNNPFSGPDFYETLCCISGELVRPQAIVYPKLIKLYKTKAGQNQNKRLQSNYKVFCLPPLPVAPCRLATRRILDIRSTGHQMLINLPIDDKHFISNCRVSSLYNLICQQVNYVAKKKIDRKPRVKR